MSNTFDFAQLKSRRGKTVEERVNAIEKTSNNGFKNDDPDVLKLTRDKDGNGYKVLRFLPASQTDLERGHTDPWVRIWSHGFKGPTGKWYIENSLTTIGQQDPVGELNSADWNDGTEAGKKRAQSRARRQQFYSNVLVIKDLENPENEGKVMKLQYGKKIFDKIESALKPKFPDDPQFDAFDMWEGADFVVKIFTEVKGQNKFPNYDRSEFKTPAPLHGGDDIRIEEVWKQCHTLSDMIAADKFKTYDELKSKLDAVLCLNGGDSVGTAEAVSDSVADEAPVSTPTQSSPQDTTPSVAESTGDSEVDDALAFFENM